MKFVDGIAVQENHTNEGESRKEPFERELIPLLPSSCCMELSRLFTRKNM
jgi:hypothetical protein